MTRPIVAAAATGALIGATAALWAFPSRAVASAPACDNIDIGHYNTAATDNTSYDAHHGMRVASPGMYIYNYDAVCIHTSSIGSVDQSGENVEVGWEDTKAGLYYEEQQCHWTGDDTPHIFRAKIRNGTYYCTVYGQLTPTQSDGFGVADQNGDSAWTFTHNGATLGDNPVQMDFSLGSNRTNGERFNTNDSAHALFNGLYYMATDGWHSWTRSQCYTASSDDPGFNNQLLSATEVQVTTAAPQC